MSEITVRPATAEDIAFFKDETVTPTARAWVGITDGKPVGMGGIAFVQGRWIAFCNVTEECRPHKKTIVRTARLIFEELRRQGVRYVYATADPKEKNAVKWMCSLGFSEDERYGQFLRWRNEDE